MQVCEVPMSVKLDNANLEVGCECECSCAENQYTGPLDWSWDGVEQYDFDVSGEIEGLGFHDYGGKWLCTECYKKATEDVHG